jgi:type II secretory pathway component PulF
MKKALLCQTYEIYAKFVAFFVTFPTNYQVLFGRISRRSNALHFCLTLAMLTAYGFAVAIGLNLVLGLWPLVHAKAITARNARPQEATTLSHGRRVIGSTHPRSSGR